MPETRSSAEKAAKVAEKRGASSSPRHASAKPDAKKNKQEKELKSEEETETDVKQEDNGEEGSPPAESKKHAAASEAAEILEKGIIYFFTRGRVNVDDPHDMADIARSYFILRPVPAASALAGSSLDDAAESARIIVLPRKTLPRKRGERMMVFVDKVGDSVVNELRETFLEGSEYETKTVGTRRVPPATPVGEGVYAMTSTGKDSHICYLLTLPAEPGPLQDEFGVASRGSFIVSTKNPQFPGPRGARLPKAPDYPPKVMESFGSYRWIPSVPEHLNYTSTQVLLIREREGLGRAGSVERDGDDRVEAEFEETMEELEEADWKRMEHLGDDASEAIYADLKADAEKYPRLRTEF